MRPVDLWFQMLILLQDLTLYNTEFHVLTLFYYSVFVSGNGWMKQKDLYGALNSTQNTVFKSVKAYYHV